MSELVGQEYLVDLLWRIVMATPGSDIALSDEFDEAVRLFADHYGPEHERGRIASGWIDD